MQLVDAQSEANPLWIRTPKTGTLINSEDAVEMPHNVAFHQNLHCLPRQNRPREKDENYSL